jgi:hypothetical protein
MIVVGTEILSGGRARASKRVAMQACTVDRFPVPYRNRTVFPFWPYYTVLDRTVP